MEVSENHVEGVPLGAGLSFVASNNLTIRGNGVSKAFASLLLWESSNSTHQSILRLKRFAVINRNLGYERLQPAIFFDAPDFG